MIDTAGNYWSDDVTVLAGDCIEVMQTMADGSVDAIVTDPPYGLEFMGKTWDSFGRGEATSRAVAGMTSTGYTDGANRIDRPSFMGGTNPKCRNCGRWQRGGNPCACEAPDFPNERRARSAAFGDWCYEWTTECLRVLKPGGHLLAFGGTRTWHRLACAVEDAGFEMRDSIAWLYGSGFPKSLDVSKAIDKAGGDPLAFRTFARAYAAAVEASPLKHSDVDRHLGIKSSSCYWAREDHRGGMPPRHHWEAARDLLRLSGEFERLYDEAEREVIGQRTTGLGTGKGSVAYIADSDNRDVTAPATEAAQQWQGWGTALKPAFEPVVVARKPLVGTVAANVLAHGTGALNIDATRIGDGSDSHGARSLTEASATTRYTDQGAVNIAATPGPRGGSPSGRWPANVVLDEDAAAELDQQSGTLTSGANPKRRGSDKFRNAYGDFTGQTECTPARGVDKGGASRFFYVAKAPKKERPVVDGVAHPTVKPLALMRWLVRLVTPPGGVVLDPFAGSGTTVEAAMLEGFRVVGIERGAEYLPLIFSRVDRQTLHAERP